jgi:hypothetical protein
MVNGGTNLEGITTLRAGLNRNIAPISCLTAFRRSPK